MRVLAACSLGGAGHLQPLLPLLDGARGQGHETLVIAPPALAGMVTETGHGFAPGGAPPEAAVAPIREQLPVVPAHEASVLGNRELFGRLATNAMLSAMDEVAADWGPDLVLRDPCEYASAVTAGERGLAAVQVGIGLADVEWASIDVARPALEAHRPGLTAELQALPYATRFPASLDPSPFRDTLRFREPVPTARSLPDWWNGSTASLVYVSFGGVLGHMSIARAVYRIALRAVARIDARVLVTVGRRFDVSRLGRVPDNVHVESWVDQADVFSEAEVAVCHGGSGTTMGALRAGVPVVMVPLFADQFANARKVAQAGAGLVIGADREDNSPRPPLSETDVLPIAEAIEAVRSHTSYREQAQGVAAEMAAAPTSDELVEHLMATRRAGRSR